MKNIYKEIDEKQASKAAELKELEAKKDAAKQAAEEAARRLEEAAKSGTVDEYADAKAESRRAEDKAEFYRMRVLALKSDSLFTEKEKEYFTSEIQKDVTSKMPAELSKLKQSIQKTVEIAEERRARIEAAAEYYKVVTGGKSYPNIEIELLKFDRMINFLKAEQNRPVIQIN